MKPADSLPDRQSSAKDAPIEPGLRNSEDKNSRDFEPKYLDVPWQKRSSSGGRNLVVGVLLLIVAIAALGQAFVLAGARVLIPVAAALLAVLTLFVLARARVLRQRNGGFLGFAAVTLLAALIPFLEYAFNRSAPSGPGTAAEGVSAEKRPADVPHGQPGAQLPQLTQVYQIRPPAENVSRIKVVRDLGVEIDGKTYLIKAGDVFAVAEQSNEEVRFNAGDQQIALRKNFVEMIAPNSAPVVAAAPIDDVQKNGQASTVDAPPAAVSKPSSAQAEEPDPSKPETPAQITQRAQKEAIRRFPALGQKNSPENQLFVETYQELKHSGADDFFADPQWPLQLAELLAKRERWKRPGQQASEPVPKTEQSPAEQSPAELDEPKQDEPTLDAPKQDQPTPELPRGEMEDLPSKQ